MSKPRCEKEPKKDPIEDRQAFLTVEDLAALLGITPRGARLVLERGELPGFRLGRRWYLRREDLDRAIAEKVAEQRRDRDAAARILRGLPAKRAPRKP
jgi:excisionase family DNA binding protein